LSVLGHRLNKGPPHQNTVLGAPPRPNTVHADNDKWAVRSLLQTIVTSLHTASLWLLTQHAADYVRFVVFNEK
jgi:hypothetical protein